MKKKKYIAPEIVIIAPSYLMDTRIGGIGAGSTGKKETLGEDQEEGWAKHGFYDTEVGEEGASYSAWE